MNRAHLAVFTVAIVLGIAARSAAQSEHLFAVGVGASATQLNGGAWDASPDWFIFRLPRPEHFGAAWDIGKDSFPVPAPATSSGVVGTLQVHHFLFGPGYTWRAGRMELTGMGLAGPATGKFRLLDDGSGPTLSSRMTWSAMAGVTAWIDLNARLGVKLSGDYLIARPTLTSSVDNMDTRWKARRLHAQLGLVFGFY